MAEHFHDVSGRCPMAGCGAAPGQPCLNIATGKPMYDPDGAPVVHPARVESCWHAPGGPAADASARAAEARARLLGRDRDDRHA